MTTYFAKTKLLAALAALSPFAAFAGTPPFMTVPAPGTWALVAVAGVLCVVVARNQRK